MSSHKRLRRALLLSQTYKWNKKIGIILLLFLLSTRVKICLCGDFLASCKCMWLYSKPKIQKIPKIPFLTPWMTHPSSVTRSRVRRHQNVTQRTLSMTTVRENTYYVTYYREYFPSMWWKGTSIASIFMGIISFLTAILFYNTSK